MSCAEDEAFTAEQFLHLTMEEFEAGIHPAAHDYLQTKGYLETVSLPVCL